MLSRTLLALSHAWNVWRVLMAPKNRAKGGWSNTDPHALYHLACGELRELQEALREHSLGKVPARRVVEECSRLGARCAMISERVTAMSEQKGA